MALEAPVLLGDVGVLQVQADVPDVHVLVVSRIDQADLISVLIVDHGVREHGKILAAHLSQLVISHFTALVQLWFYLDVQNGGSDHGADQPHGEQGQKRAQKPSQNSKDADEEMPQSRYGADQDTF